MKLYCLYGKVMYMNVPASLFLISQCKLRILLACFRLFFNFDLELASNILSLGNFESVKFCTVSGMYIFMK